MKLRINDEPQPEFGLARAINVSYNSRMQKAPLTQAARQKALRGMLEIRIAEDKIQEMFMANLVRGTAHLCIGQEACSAGMAAALQARRHRDLHLSRPRPRAWRWA